MVFTGQFIDYPPINGCIGIRRVPDDGAARDDVWGVLMPLTLFIELPWQETPDVTYAENAVRHEEREEEIKFPLVLDVRMNIPQPRNQVLALNFNDSGPSRHSDILRWSDGCDSVVIDHHRGVGHVRATLAKAFGLSGSWKTYPQDQGGSTYVGDPSKGEASLGISPDATLSWWYSAAWDTQAVWACAEPAIAVDPVASDGATSSGSTSSVTG